MRNVYCIIVTYNAMPWIDKCINSLMQSSENIKIIVVDNCSSDQTVQHIKKNYKNVILILNSKNKGFGKANNQGIEYAYKQGCEHFFLLNQDAWVSINTIKKLVDIQIDYQIDVLSPTHLNGRGDIFDYNYFIHTVISEKNRDFVSDLFLNRLNSFYLVFKANAAAWMISRETIESVGGFDPLFFHYGEDGNYCQRLKYHNKKFAFTPHSVIFHDRERQGNMKVYKKNAQLRDLIFEYSNINKKIWIIDKKRIKIHGYVLYCLILYLITFKIKNLIELCSEYLKFPLSYFKIQKSMHINKKKGPNWLEL